jgi:ferredoxin
MSHSFTAYRYIRTPAGESVLDVAEVPINLASPHIEAPARGTLLLTGGFTSIMADDAIPVSATLQLNGDLAGHDPEVLRAIAAAELRRHTGGSWRTTTHEADRRVAVVAGDVSRLQKFIDRYGGVLDIEPLLLNGYHPEFATAANLVIEQAEHLLLSFQVRTPVHRERCTYCGACGPVCPVDCITPSMFIDLARCTYCGECVAVCPHEAVELYLAENRTLEIPAVIILERSSLEYDETLPNVFHESQLAEYFASLADYQVEEIIGCDPGLCQYHPEMAVGCTKCFSACDFDAIAKTKQGIRVDHRRCVECGSCVAVCPTGAMQYLRFTDRAFFQYLDELAPMTIDTVVVGDESQLHRFWWRYSTTSYEHTFFLEYPNPRALSPMHCMMLLARGVRRLFILHDETKEGESALPVPGAPVANAIWSALYGAGQYVVTGDGSALAKTLTETSGNEAVPKVETGSFINRREQLMSILRSLSKTHTQELSFTGKDFAVYGSVDCDQDACTLCLACLNGCKIGSLQGDGETFALTQRASLCVQCGVCVHICPEDALRLRPGLALNDAFFANQELARSEKMKCAGCGKIFGTVKSYERVMAVLAEKKMLDDQPDLFAYCEKCRVVKRFERMQDHE